VWQWERVIVGAPQTVRAYVERYAAGQHLQLLGGVLPVGRPHPGRGVTFLGPMCHGSDAALRRISCASQCGRLKRAGKMLIRLLACGQC
jgi:hypothetical protein